MAYPTSASFDAQQQADSNIVRARVWGSFGDYGIGDGPSWSSKGSATLSDPSVFDSDNYDVADLGDGVRQHRNFGDVEDTGKGRGWLGGMKTDGIGAYSGILIRNLESPNDGNQTNGPAPGTGKKLAIRAQAPTPGGGVVSVTIQQFALRISPVGSPGAITVRLYTEAAGAPGAVLLTVAVNPADSVDGWVYIETGGPVSFVPGAFFWIVVDTQTASAVNNWTWAYVNSSNVNEFASENAVGAWVAQTYRLHYRTTFSWAAGPTPGEYVTVTLPAARRLNRIRVYSYPSTRVVTGQGIAAFTVQTGVAGIFTDAAISSAKGSDYGDGAAVVTVVGAQVATGNATYFDILFPTVTADAVRIIVTMTSTVSDFARLIAVEIFDRVELTDRVMAATSNIQRDLFLQLDQARILDLSCTNTDRFFSPFYNPTAAQIAAGYHNSELRPDLSTYQPLLIETEQGFLTNEFVPLGEFYADRYDFPFKQKSCQIQARDFNKFLLRNDLSENLRQFDRLEDLIELCANRANFSSSRMVLNTTETRVPFFMPIASKSRAEIDELCKAGVTGIIRFDESGVMRFLTFAPSSMSIGALPQALVTQTPYGTKFQALAGPLLESNVPWSHVIMSGERAYVSTLYTDVGFVSDFQTIIEYDVIGRTILREIKTETANQGLDPTIKQPFANLALDGGFIYTTRKDRALKIDLTTLAVTTLDLSLLGIAGFQKTHQYSGVGVVVAGRYYFVFDAAFAGAIAWLGSVNATTMAGVSFINHGAFEVPDARVQRLVHWNPVAGVDRIYFAFEPFATQGVITFTYYDIFLGTLANDAINRVGVTTDGTLLYELLAAVGGVHTLQSRDSVGATVVLGTQPANDDETAGIAVASIGPCIGYAGNRVWSVYRTSTTQILRLFNLIEDVHFFDNEIPEQLQASPIFEDRSTGRLILFGQQHPFGPFSSGNPLIHALRLRMFECPHAPTASTFRADWNDQLLDGKMSVTEENAGSSSVLTRVTFIMHPLSVGSPVVTWVAAVNGAPISSNNPLALGNVSLVAGHLGGVRFMPTKPGTGKLRVPFSTDFAAYLSPVATAGATGPGVSVDADGLATFGPATGRSILPFVGAPQSVWWQTLTGSDPLSITLSPHPSQPVMTIIPGALVCDLIQLQIVATPFLRDTEVSVEATSEDVFEDGAEILSRNGDNSVEISNDYIGDVCMLRIAALELIRLYGRPQVQVSGVNLRWNPALGMEDVGNLKESETGFQAKLQVVGLQQSFAVAGRSLTVSTTPRLVTLPVVSTTGTGQGPVTPLGGPPVPE